jgi:hypothetical protein
MLRKTLYGAGLALLFASPLTCRSQGTENPSCKADKRIVGQCFLVHARYSNWNGNPTGRLWIIGTNRMLGIREDTDLPPTLLKGLGEFDDTATGDFEVCPLTHEKPGVMQIVCVASAQHVTFSKRRPNK